MAASAERRVVLNRAVLDAITLATADGLFEMAKAVVFDARPPVGVERRYKGRVTRPLHESGGAVAWVNGKKVATTTIGGKQIKAPRGLGVSRIPIVAVGGFGLPGHLVEFGTVKMGAEPFLTPSLLAHRPDTIDFVRLGLTKHALTRDIVKGLKVANAHGDTQAVRAGRAAARKVSRVGPTGRLLPRRRGR